ncbi:MAG: carboxypeptidase regulatory-like domain-containing protein [Thermoplasmatota archaeon]
MHRIVLLLLSVAFLAGCTDEETPEPAAPEDETITLSGIVQDRNVVPVQGATVSIRDSNQTFVTGADGLFQFELDEGFYILDATAPDHDEVTLTYTPGEPPELLIVLTRIAQEPFQATQAFKGIIECAAEYLIITPSCDTVLEYTADQGVPLPNGGSVTSDEAAFDIFADPEWQTLVVDVVFDITGQPGLEALRTVFSGLTDPNALTSYEQFGRFQGATSYTFRIEPGASYPDGDAPVDGNITAFRLNVYGQGHGWHATCDATGQPDTCTLGVGAGIDVRFDVFVTAFYVEPAPEGWSFQA